MHALQKQLTHIGDFEHQPITSASASAYAARAEAAAPPLIELLADYELRVAELRNNAMRQEAMRPEPPGTKRDVIVDVELARLPDDEAAAPVEADELGEHDDLDIVVDLPDGDDASPDDPPQPPPEDDLDNATV